MLLVTGGTRAWEDLPCPGCWGGMVAGSVVELKLSRRRCSGRAGQGCAPEVRDLVPIQEVPVGWFAAGKEYISRCLEADGHSLVPVRQAWVWLCWVICVSEQERGFEPSTCWALSPLCLGDSHWALLGLPSSRVLIVWKLMDWVNLINPEKQVPLQHTFS